ncbi:MAG: hypothetical protein U1F77_20380 [Kiritimatiellia bacterium]
MNASTALSLISGFGLEGMLVALVVPAALITGTVVMARRSRETGRLLQQIAWLVLVLFLARVVGLIDKNLQAPGVANSALLALCISGFTFYLRAGLFLGALCEGILSLTPATPRQRLVHALGAAILGGLCYVAGAFEDEMVLLMKGVSP